MQYFVNRSQQQYGPYSFDDLRNFVEQGIFSPHDQARAESMPDWTTLQVLLQQGYIAHPQPPASPELTAPVVVSSPVAEIAVSSPPPKKSFWNPLIWPMRQPSWFASLWVPLLWWIFILLLPTPPLALLALLVSIPLNIGWFIDAVRRRGHKEPHLLPQSGSVFVMLKDGLVFLVMCVFYFTIPMLIIGVVFQWSQDSFMMDAAEWVGHWITYWLSSSANARPETLVEFITGQEQKLVLSAVVPIAYLIVSIPMFIVATVRFAVTRKILSYFKVFTNFFLLLRHQLSFLWMVILALVWYTVLYGGAFVINQLGVFLQPFVGALTGMILFPVTLWVAAYLAGNFAVRLCESKSLTAEKHW